MAFIPTTCTQCGANIEIDDTHKTGMCRYCGTSFITEKMINIGNEETNAAIEGLGSTDTKYIYNVEISDEQAAEIEELIRQEETVKAIKLVRAIANVGLRDAKDFVDAHTTGVWSSTASEAPNGTVDRTESSSSGCYVATCVYGSYDCPEVWTLRRFRDYTLDETWYGRLFIKCYYAVSPAIVSIFGNTEWFRGFWKKRLDKMIAKLRAQGVEDTEYIDKY